MRWPATAGTINASSPWTHRAFVPTWPVLVPRLKTRQASDIDAAQDRIAALETRLEVQEAILRRVLTLLVDWAERDLPPAWSPEAERRSGKDRRFHAV